MAFNIFTSIKDNQIIRIRSTLIVTNIFWCIKGWTDEDCSIPDCGDGACYIDEGRGYCDGSTGIPECKCNTEDVSITLSLYYMQSCISLVMYGGVNFLKLQKLSYLTLNKEETKGRYARFELRTQL